MCRMCIKGRPHHATGSLRSSRRDFLKVSAATGAAAGLNLFGARADAAQDIDDASRDFGRPGRRYVIRGGHVMSMDPQVGDFVEADVLVEGKKIVGVRPNLPVSGAGVIDARGRIVMPGSSIRTITSSRRAAPRAFPSRLTWQYTLCRHAAET